MRKYRCETLDIICELLESGSEYIELNYGNLKTYNSKLTNFKKYIRNHYLEKVVAIATHGHSIRLVAIDRTGCKSYDELARYLEGMEWSQESPGQPLSGGDCGTS